MATKNELIQSKLEEWEKLLDQASKGEWGYAIEHLTDITREVHIGSSEGQIVFSKIAGSETSDEELLANCKLICEFMQFLPMLLEEWENLSRANDDYRKILNNIHGLLNPKDQNKIERWDQKLKSTPNSVSTEARTSTRLERVLRHAK